MQEVLMEANEPHTIRKVHDTSITRVVGEQFKICIF